MKFLGKTVFGDLLLIIGIGFVLLVIAAVAWDVIAAAITRLRHHFGIEPPAPVRPSNSRRTPESRERHAARTAARRAALHTERTDP